MIIVDNILIIYDAGPEFYNPWEGEISFCPGISAREGHQLKCSDLEHMEPTIGHLKFIPSKAQFCIGGEI